MSTDAFPWTDVSLDIETLDNKFSSAILSIGAVAFDRRTGKLGKTYYREIDIDSAIKYGTVSASMLCWWMNQGEKAKEIFDDSAKGKERKVHLATALQEFCTFIRSLGAPFVWGNGSSFDVTIIEHAINTGSVGLVAPWSFWNVRDVRTVVDLAETITPWRKASVERDGVHHNALDDAAHQARLVLGGMVALGHKYTAASTGKKIVKPVEPADDDDDL